MLVVFVVCTNEWTKGDVANNRKAERVEVVNFIVICLLVCVCVCVCVLGIAMTKGNGRYFPRFSCSYYCVRELNREHLLEQPMRCLDNDVEVGVAMDRGTSTVFVV